MPEERKQNPQIYK